MRKVFEPAFGHHRIEARGQLGAEEVTIGLIHADDDRLFQLMAFENLEEWNAPAVVDQTVIRALAVGYAEGRLHLKKPESKTSHNQIR